MSAQLPARRHTGGPADGWQRRVFGAHVLTLFAGGGIVEHAVDARAPRFIVIPRGGVVSSLREVEESVRFVHDCAMFSLQLGDDMLRDAAHETGQRAGALLLPSPGICDPQVTRLMLALCADGVAGWANDALATDSAMQALALRLIGAGAVPASARHGLSPAQASRVAALVEEELARPLRLADLAAETGYSIAQFTRLFRATFGTSALRYVTTRRIERACRMLRHSGWAQIEIALDCGFGSQQRFARVFRAEVGITPQAYRKRG